MPRKQKQARGNAERPKTLSEEHRTAIVEAAGELNNSICNFNDCLDDLASDTAMFRESLKNAGVDLKSLPPRRDCLGGPLGICLGIWMRIDEDELPVILGKFFAGDQGRHL